MKNELDCITSSKIFDLKNDQDLSMLGEKDLIFLESIFNRYNTYGPLMRCSVKQRNYINDIYQKVFR